MSSQFIMGTDDFREIREQKKYYVDKTLLIKDFLEYGDKVTLITRPRRFGKTLNMTMLREFFDITKDSHDIFKGLSVMETEYASQINTRPVIFISLRECKANTADLLLYKIKNLMLNEYDKYYKILKGNVDETLLVYRKFFVLYEKLFADKIENQFLEPSLALLEEVLNEYYKIKPIVLIDEYDQPVLSSYENGYRDELKTFFSGFYSLALKGQECLYKAALTGVQRVAKEGIFSGLNNVSVYTVADGKYSGYFGFTADETEALLKVSDLKLDDAVKQMYDGYIFGRTEIYNPWSIVSYAVRRELKRYWINTGENAVIKNIIRDADSMFNKDFDELVSSGSVEVAVNLESSLMELKNHESVWGLLLSAGYLTIAKQIDIDRLRLRIPNDEVKGAFRGIIAELINIPHNSLLKMFDCLSKDDIDSFIPVYREILLKYLSSYDVVENSYHMLFLGMSISVSGLYEIRSNIESGHGRSDILMKSLSKERKHIIIEFKKAKKGESLEKLKDKALQQIKDNQYYAGLNGSVLCIGIAHDKKNCTITHEIVVCSNKF